MEKRIEKIIAKYFDEKLTDEEAVDLIDWIEKGNIEIFNKYVTLNYSVEEQQAIIKNDGSSWDEIALKINKSKRTIKLNYWKYAAAASILLLVTLTVFINKDKGFDIDTPIIVNDIIEIGSHKAILTLDNGNEISLEKGKEYQTNNLNTNGESLFYNQKEQGKKVEGKLVYNYLTVPKGGEFFVQLEDGTKVWLNSESQLKYPVSFVEGESRRVELIYGEAYFHVSPSTKHQGADFKVFNNKQEIKVLGTEFNIKAYKDEINIYTTLVEGKVSINYEGLKRILSPNQQSIINTVNNSFTTKTVDVYTETSWREGIFSFEEKSLKEIMKVLSRWYDIEVVFKNKAVEDEVFIGTLGKNQKIEEILTTIKTFGIINGYEIENKKVVLE